MWGNIMAETNTSARKTRKVEWGVPDTSPKAKQDREERIQQRQDKRYVQKQNIKWGTLLPPKDASSAEYTPTLLKDISVSGETPLPSLTSSPSLMEAQRIEDDKEIAARRLRINELATTIRDKNLVYPLSNTAGQLTRPQIDIGELSAYVSDQGVTFDPYVPQTRAAQQLTDIQNGIRRQRLSETGQRMVSPRLTEALGTRPITQNQLWGILSAVGASMDPANPLHKANYAMALDQEKGLSEEAIYQEALKQLQQNYQMEQSRVASKYAEPSAQANLDRLGLLNVKDKQSLLEGMQGMSIDEQKKLTSNAIQQQFIIGNRSGISNDFMATSPDGTQYWTGMPKGQPAIDYINMTLENYGMRPTGLNPTQTAQYDYAMLSKATQFATEILEDNTATELTDGPIVDIVASSILSQEYLDNNPSIIGFEVATTDGKKTNDVSITTLARGWDTNGNPTTIRSKDSIRMTRKEFTERLQQGISNYGR